MVDFSCCFARNPLFGKEKEFHILWLSWSLRNVWSTESRCTWNGGTRCCFAHVRIVIDLLCVFAVLNELDGLCRSRLATEARSALAFLREKNPQVRYVTSKGAPLPTFAAGTMTEESDDQVRRVRSLEIRALFVLVITGPLLRQLLPTIVPVITTIPWNPCA